MKKILSFTLAAVVLSGCSMFSGSDVPPQPMCPATGFMVDADTAAFFANADKKPTPEDIAVSAILKNINGACHTGGDRSSIDLTFDVVAQKADLAGDQDRQNLSYFIAVLGPGEEILQRENFYATVVFEQDAKIGFVNEEHTVDIPLAPGAAVHQYSIVISFALTPEQLAFNRRYHYDLSKKQP